MEPVGQSYAIKAAVHKARTTERTANDLARQWHHPSTRSSKSSKSSGHPSRGIVTRPVYYPNPSQHWTYQDLCQGRLWTPRSATSSESTLQPRFVNIKPSRAADHEPITLSALISSMCFPPLEIITGHVSDISREFHSIADCQLPCDFPQDRVSKALLIKNAFWIRTRSL